MTIKNGLALFTGFIDKYLIEETAVLNVLTDPRKTISCDSRLQSDIVRGKNILVFVDSYKERA
jgi:hypothetical protein